MRILFLSQLWPLPLDAGPKIRCYYVLRYLAEAGHEVTLLCFVRPEDRERDLRSLNRICRSVHVVPILRSRFQDLRFGVGSLFSSTPFLILRDQNVEMYRSLDRIIDGSSFDALHADQLWMAPYGLSCDGPGIKVLDQHNAVFRIPLQLSEHQRNPLMRALLQKEAFKLSSFERQTCRRYNQVVWVTEEDRQAVIPAHEGCPGAHHIIPIAIDPAARLRVDRQHPFRITMLGGMHWPPNLEGISWFMERIWPRVASAAPESVLTLIGKRPPARLARAASHGQVKIAGYVSDLQTFLSETAAFVVPLRTGAGMRVKILDAWCWGLPVVSTSIGAQGIRAAHGENLLLADDEDSFAECLIRVLKDTKLAHRLADGGRATVEACYDWRKAYQAWDWIYN